jgi:Tfp pilus assembly protein PilN
MPQQINLFSPVLLAPRHHFPARTMAFALGLWIGALLALAAFATWRTQVLSSELGQTAQRHAAERTRLTQAQSVRLAALGDPAALQEELARARARLDERRALLEELDGASVESSPTRLLAELAEGLPAPVWLEEIRWAPGHVELAGHTLQPEALQAWLARNKEPRTLRVEQRGAAGGGAASWSFRLRRGGGGQAPAAAPAAATTTASAQRAGS